MRNLADILTERFLELAVILEEDAVDLLFEKKVEADDNKHHHHLDHAEDHVIRNKGAGFNDMISTLTSAHDHLSGGRKPPGFNLSTKMDGSPSIVFGHHPDNGKFFVGTKGFFNKTPKVNFNDKDVDHNHGSTPVLSNKLKGLLKHLKGTVPSKGVFQGDLMYTSDEVADFKHSLSFTPNTITYNVNKNSPEAKKVLKSKIGIAPHTEYEKGPNGSMVAKFGVDLAKFKKTDDVHLMDTKVKGPFKYSPANKKKFAEHISNARELQKKLVDRGAYKDVLKNHEKLLLGYINSAVKTKKANSVEGYITYLNRQFAAKSDGSDKSSARYELDRELTNVAANKGTFNTLFQAHKQVQNAKNILVNVMSQSSPYKENILGTPSKPEGYVASSNNKPIKLVDRGHFSAANFDWNEKANPDDNPVVLSWGRMNPITKGHEKMLAKGADIARRTGAKQLTVATDKHDGMKNPFTPQEKLKWMKTLFPGQEVALAGKEASTLIAQLQQLHHKGTKDVTIVAGADRVPEYSRILAKYNGPGKLFHFSKARVVSSGERDPDSNAGTEGVSATKVRHAAKKNDYKAFKLGMPSKADDKQAKEMFHTLRAEMGAVQIGSGTDAHALSIYSRRAVGDKIGNQARVEIQKRKRAGKWHGA